MTNYKAILGYYHKGNTTTQIAKLCECSRTTVLKTIKRAKQCGIDLPLSDKTSDYDLLKTLYSHSSKSIGGKFKSVQNYITLTENGKESILFTPPAPYETPDAIEKICNELNIAISKCEVDPLILIPIFIHDFLCIHPFSDGNGRMSRLLTTLLLYNIIKKPLVFALFNHIWQEDSFGRSFNKYCFIRKKQIASA